MAVIGFASCVYVPMWFVSAFRTQRLPAHQAAVEDYTERCKSMRAKRNNGYEVFFPPNVSIGDSVNKAFIFYPELLVDHMAYAIVLGKLSDRGILVVLVNAEPSRCCTEIATVNHLKRLVHEITTLMDISVKEWVLGGHSLGGLAASAIFMKHPPSEIPKSITRLVQWTVPGEASRLRRRKKDSSCTIRLKSALLINATRDGVVVPFDNRVQCASTNNDFQDDDGFKFEIEMIIGGNHSGFAHYGPQLFPMDWERRGISLGEQQVKAVNLTADFILDSNIN
jgi:pimeloyl-ACP methyl ester carboxylesterase